MEDDLSLQRVLVDKFKSEGFDVLAAANGEEGLITAAEKPDMILLDIIMPRMDGMTMLKKLRASSYGKNANVIILSNLSDAESVAESVKNGVFDYLVKTDWKLDSVVERVKEALRMNS